MLVLSVKLNGGPIRIMVGDETILIQVTAIQGRNVKLGITAPRHIPIHRESVYQRIKSEGSNREGKHASEDQ